MLSPPRSSSRTELPARATRFAFTILNNGIMDVQRDQQCELLRHGELIHRLSLRKDRALSPMASACLPCEALTSSPCRPDKNLCRKLGQKWIRKGNQSMCVSDCPRARLFSSMCACRRASLKTQAGYTRADENSQTTLTSKKKNDRDSLSLCLCWSRCLAWPKFFFVQKSKIGSEAYVIGVQISQIGSEAEVFACNFFLKKESEA